MPNLSYRTFDFKSSESHLEALKTIDILFLIRPPQISNVRKVFKPLLQSAAEQGIENVVFLSVQGAEKSNIIPHRKIELLIKSFELNYIFLRPSYFMQNLTTTFLEEIRNHHRLSLPAGNAKFNWVDVKDIGRAIAVVLVNFEKFSNASYELTGTENISFEEVSRILSQEMGVAIRYNKMNAIAYYFKKKKRGELT